MSRGKVVIAPVKLFFSWQVHWFGILADKMTAEDMDVRLSWEVCLCQLYFSFSFFNLTYICYDWHQEKRWIACHTSTVIVKLNDFVVKKKKLHTTQCEGDCGSPGWWVKKLIWKESICNHLHYDIMTFTWTFQTWSLNMRLVGGCTVSPFTFPFIKVNQKILKTVIQQWIKRAKCTIMWFYIE